MSEAARSSVSPRPVRSPPFASQAPVVPFKLHSPAFHTDLRSPLFLSSSQQNLKTTNRKAHAYRLPLFLFFLFFLPAASGKVVDVRTHSSTLVTSRAALASRENIYPRAEISACISAYICIRGIKDSSTSRVTRRCVMRVLHSTRARPTSLTPIRFRALYSSLTGHSCITCSRCITRLYCPDNFRWGCDWLRGIEFCIEFSG